MMTLNQAIAYGKSIGVMFYIKNEFGCIFGGAKTKEDAEAMMKRQSKEWPNMKLHIEEV